MYIQMISGFLYVPAESILLREVLDDTLFTLTSYLITAK